MQRQYSVVQYSTIQYNRLEYNTVQLGGASEMSIKMEETLQTEFLYSMYLV